MKTSTQAFGLAGIAIVTAVVAHHGQLTGGIVPALATVSIFLSSIGIWFAHTEQS